jgi:hypothetical protein
MVVTSGLSAGTITKAIDMKQIIFITAAFLLSAGFVSCSKSDNPGGSGQPQVASMLTGTNRSSSLGGISKDSLSWTSAKAQVTMVKFEAKSAGQEIEYKSNQQRSIDLISTDPLAGNFQLPAGTYDEVELKTVLTPSGGLPSLELKGSFINGGVSIPVTFQSNASLEVKGEKKNITVEPGSTYDISTLVNLSVVFRGISAADLAAATRTNGEIRISNTENSKLYNIITNNLNNLKDECEIHRH